MNSSSTRSIKTNNPAKCIGQKERESTFLSGRIGLKKPLNLVGWHLGALRLVIGLDLHRKKAWTTIMKVLAFTAHRKSLTSGYSSTLKNSKELHLLTQPPKCKTHINWFTKNQCFQNRTGDRTGKVTGSRFTGRTGGRTAIEPVTS